MVVPLALGLFAWGALGLHSALAPAQQTVDAAARASRPLDGVAVAGGQAGGLSAGIATLQQHLRDQPSDSVSWATLGLDYVAQAKATSDPSYYPKAEGALKQSLAIGTPDDFVAMAGMGALANARHDFAQGLTWAKKAEAVDPQNSTVQGILADSLTQLGRYPESFQATQRMVDLEPGTPSLSRASYTWELRGDTAQAASLMRRALTDASAPADRSFAHYYLAELAFGAGDPGAALAEDRAGLRETPDDPALLESRAKAEAALGDTKSALADYKRAVGLVPQPQYVVELGELQQSLGQNSDAQQTYGLFRAEEQLFTANGVALDTDTTLFDADHGSPAQALRDAEAGIKVRPFVEMDDAYAWALHMNGKDAEALAWAGKAAALGTRSALFAFHRGMIESSLGLTAAAGRDLADALHTNPWFNPLQAPVARAELARLTGEPRPTATPRPMAEPRRAQS